MIPDIDDHHLSPRAQADFQRCVDAIGSFGLATWSPVAVFMRTAGRVSRGSVDKYIGILASAGRVHRVAAGQYRTAQGSMPDVETGKARNVGGGHHIGGKIER